MPNPLADIELQPPNQRARLLLEASLISSLERDFPKLDLTRRTVKLAEIINALPRDAIRAIARRQFDSVAEAGAWLDDSEPVIVVELNEDVRSYPLRILVWHELVNDEIGGQPVMATYCPLCITAPSSAPSTARSVRSGSRASCGATT